MSSLLRGTVDNYPKAGDRWRRPLRTSPVSRSSGTSANLPMARRRAWIIPKHAIAGLSKSALTVIRERRWTVHNPIRGVGLASLRGYAACSIRGRRRWQQQRSSHPVKRQRRRGSDGRRDARPRQPGSETPPPQRLLRHARKTRRLRPNSPASLRRMPMMASGGTATQIQNCRPLAPSSMRASHPRSALAAHWPF